MALLVTLSAFQTINAQSAKNAEKSKDTARTDITGSVVVEGKDAYFYKVTDPTNGIVARVKIKNKTRKAKTFVIYIKEQ